MMLSPKARRFVSDALERMPEGRDARAAWDAFEHGGANDLSAQVARIALQALEFAEQELRSRLQHAELDEDEQADLSNDLYFVRTVERDLRDHAR